MQQHPRRWALEQPDRIAISYPSLDVNISYRTLDERANKAAHFMRAQGLERGDNIALLIENTPVFHEICWAAHNAGLYYTAISWRFRSDEIIHILKNSGARILFYTAQQREIVAQIKGRLAIRFVDVTDQTYCDDLPANPIGDESRGSDMLYSSGSTGMPKGIKQILPDSSIDGLSKMFAVYADRYDWNEETVYLMPCPIYHSGPMRFTMAMQHIGARIVIMEKFDAVEALRLVEKERINWAHWVPTMLVRIMKLPKAVRDGFDLSSLRGIVHGAAPIAPDIKRQAIEYFGPILEESYGGTEGNGLTLISSHEWLNHPGSVGRPFLGSIHILDDAGRELPAGEIGTVWFSGGPEFEYHGQPDRTREAFDTTGRSTIEDVGYLDKDGYLYLTGRLKNMVISGGVNVYPQEAENALMLHDGVADACVFGVPDDDMGEVLHAAIQPLDQTANREELEADLRRWCRSRLASIKLPRSYEFRETLPRHDTGKIYVRHLKREWLVERAGAGRHAAPE
ncbi:AMP-binding protein [Croceicoccus sp. YJ47]|nr:AMP-binding protein [Croceicoccus sp. YJ47]QQN75281.1 AMP-binding protein [Croceicoccus sp. YJ47]